MTYDELVQKVGPNGDMDPFWLKNDEYLITPQGVIFFGKYDETYHVHDVKIRINPDQTYTVWLRDPEDQESGESYGKDWSHENTFSDFEDAHTWAMG